MDGRRQYPTDFADQVSLGIVPGFKDILRWNENEQVDSTQEEMSNIASGIRTLPSSATVITIASSSAEDDPDDGVDAGTGIHSVHVYYLDANYLERSEIVSLNGTANVTTTGTAIRFIAAHAQTVGSSGAAAGNISFTIDGNVQSRIKVGHNETRETGISCPDDKLILLRSFEIFTGRSATVDTDFAIEIRDQTTGIWYTVVSADVYQNAVDLTDRNIILGPRDDLRVLCTASGTGPRAFVSLHGWEMEKTVLISMGSDYAINGVPVVAR